MNAAPDPKRSSRRRWRPATKAVLAAVVLVPLSLGMAGCDADSTKKAANRSDACEKIMSLSNSLGEKKDTATAKKEAKELADELDKLADEKNDDKLRKAAKELRTINPGGEPESVGEIIKETSKRMKIIRNACVNIGD
ncbi:hypothetical protein [Streptomyces sp. MST-110588]|uniref:hypothetical protein n=1 Tax=Streptomyces sp. MST-110588 TaxID=2833628 RepID=UPI001F5D2007|nr:hypothetical protein [Streptomyces sp. MST-110588]UNO41471.1 hypothetical protein KGS77_20250 [Streptomyces sp. MST-110588]